MSRNDEYRHERQYDDEYCQEDSGYTREELDRMYEAAFEGDPEAEWNID